MFFGLRVEWTKLSSLSMQSAPVNQAPVSLFNRSLKLPSGQLCPFHSKASKQCTPAGATVGTAPAGAIVGAAPAGAIVSTALAGVIGGRG